MQKAPFSTFLNQLKEQRLSKDKFYFLKQAASAFYFFNGDQLCQIALCFPHSTDKKEAVAFLETRLATDISCETAARVIKSASFSRDRLGILQILVGHLKRVTEDDEQKIVIGAFDFFIDRDQAWSILAKQCEVFGGSCPALTAPDEEIIEHVPTPQIHQMVRDVAKEQTQATLESLASVAFPEVEPRPRLSIFDLPIMSNLSILQQELPSMESKIYEEVKRRRETGQNFVIPSRLWTITTNLKPGRRLTLPEPESPSDKFPALPDVVLDTERRSPIREATEAQADDESERTSEVSTSLVISQGEDEAIEAIAPQKSSAKTKRLLRKRIKGSGTKTNASAAPSVTKSVQQLVPLRVQSTEQKPTAAEPRGREPELVMYWKESTEPPHSASGDSRRTAEALSVANQSREITTDAIPESCSSPIPLSMYYRQEQFSPVTRSVGQSPVTMSPVHRYYKSQQKERAPDFRGSVSQLSKVAERPHSARSWRRAPDHKAFSTTNLNRVGTIGYRPPYGTLENIPMDSLRMRYRARFSKPDIRPQYFESGDGCYQTRSTMAPPYHYSSHRSPSSRLYYIR